MNTSTYKMVKIIYFIFTIICTLVFWFLGDDYLTLTTANGPFEFIKMLAGIAGTLLGFLIGAVSLLTAVMDRTLIENMRKNGQFEILINQTFASCLWLIFLIVACFSSFLVDTNYLKFSFSVIIFLAIYSVISVISIGYKFKNIFVVMS